MSRTGLVAVVLLSACVLVAVAGGGDETPLLLEETRVELPRVVDNGHALAGCARNCSAHGRCVDGKCACDAWYGGDDCSKGTGKAEPPAKALPLGNMSIAGVVCACVLVLATVFAFAFIWRKRNLESEFYELVDENTFMLVLTALHMIVLSAVVLALGILLDHYTFRYDEYDSYAPKEEKVQQEDTRMGLLATVYFCVVTDLAATAVTLVGSFKRVRGVLVAGMALNSVALFADMLWSVVLAATADDLAKVQLLHSQHVLVAEQSQVFVIWSFVGLLFIVHLLFVIVSGVRADLCCAFCPGHRVTEYYRIENAFSSWGGNARREPLLS